MSPKEQIEQALRLAVHALIVKHVIREYLQEVGNAATVDDLPRLRKRIGELHGF